jgi:peptidoglycan-associated lipoprotein
MREHSLIFPRTIWTRSFVVVALFVTGCAYYNTFYNARSQYRAGLDLENRNQAEAAKPSFDKAVEKSALVIKRWPRSRWVDDALFLIGMSYYHEGNYDKAVRYFDQLALAFPASGFTAEAELYRGLSLLAGKQYGPARVALDGVRQRYPRFAAAAAFHMANSFLERDETEKGIDSLAVFVQRPPRSRYYREAVGALADGNFKLDRCDEAEKWYLRMIRIASDPRDRAQAKLRVAACRYKEGQYEDAVRQIEDLLGRYPELDNEANLIMGKSLLELGRPADAVAVWSNVRGANDFGAEAAFRIGKYHEEQSDFAAARAYYDTSRTRQGNSDYGVLAVKRLSLLDAFSQQQSGKREPAEALFLLAEVNNLNLEDYDKAMNLYQKVHDSFPETDWAGKALFAKAWIARNVKHDTATAQPLLAQVIAEYPETEYADESRRWLGLPVPKRKPKKPEVKAETTMARADTSAQANAVPEVPPVPPEATPPESTTIVSVEKGTTGEPPHRPGPAEDMKRRLGELPGMPPAPSGKGPGTSPVEKLPAAVTDTSRAKPPEPQKPSAASPTEPEKPATAPASARTTASAIAHFETDRWAIQPADSAGLRALADSLKAHPEKTWVVLGFCDPRASERYNQRLGLRRAQAVKDYLVSLGVSADRLEVESRGKEQLLSTRPEEYWLDRRVESAPR